MDGYVQKLGQRGRQSDEGGAGIKDSTSVVNFSSLVAERYGVKVNLPVGLAAERDLGHLASVVGLINTTEHSLRSITIVVGVAQVESKDLLIKKALVDHVVERRGDLVNGDGIVAESQDAVKSAEGEGETWL